ncbi:MAG: hypothetical protein C5B49_03055, partial [Bdellovibrio sp.]
RIEKLLFNVELIALLMVLSGLIGLLLALFQIRERWRNLMTLLDLLGWSPRQQSDFIVIQCGLLIVLPLILGVITGVYCTPRF